jgi:hypothetical protein
VHAVRDDAHVVAERCGKISAFSGLGTLDARPADAGRRIAAAAARAFREAERQSHLESKIGAQEIRKIGAVRTKHDLHLVFAETKMVEQDVAGFVAQHFVQRRP